MIEHVDPFIGSAATDLPPPAGLAASWWMPKPQVGNTHPGATFPFGMVSACAYSGAYPTGYGQYELSTAGVPDVRYERLSASGFTHFQQSGTGAIRKYYNYLRVTPMTESLDSLDTLVPIHDEVAQPGYYACTLDTGIRAETTVGPTSAVHRATFPGHRDARYVVDCSLGGLAIDHGRTVPLRANLRTVSPGVAHGEIVVEGAPLAFHIECDAPEWRQLLWYDHRVVHGGTRLDFDHIRPTTLRSFGFVFAGPTEPGQRVELRIGFSLRGVDQAAANLRADCGDRPTSFDDRRVATTAVWREHLDKVHVETPSNDRQVVFGTALYHSLIKPCFAADESPWWPGGGPFVFDLATMWDIYRTQLPLLTTLWPDRAAELAIALLRICEEEGNLPIGYRMAKGADRFFRQASALAHTFLADVCSAGLDGVDWEWALSHMELDLRRQFGEDFLETGVAHPISHTLDLALGYHCSARVARHLGDDASADHLDALGSRWANAFDPATGLLVDSTFYEGGRWNYSFRLLHDMASRIELAGGGTRFCELLDRFFGFGAPPVKQLGSSPTPQEIADGYALDRFQGLNNEPDMEAPWAYHYVGRPDRTAEVVRAAVHDQFGVGRGGLPGNDDSGGLSSWYVWASLGIFPNAGQDLFFLNAPSFAHARLRLDQADLTVDTVGFEESDADGPPQYVTAARLDGRPIDRSWIPGSDLRRGGHLVFELGPEPSDWGASSLPPSVSTTPPTTRGDTRS